MISQATAMRESEHAEYQKARHPSDKGSAH